MTTIVRHLRTEDAHCCSSDGEIFCSCLTQDFSRSTVQSLLCYAFYFIRRQTHPQPRCFLLNLFADNKLDGPSPVWPGRHRVHKFQKAADILSPQESFPTSPQSILNYLRRRRHQRMWILFTCSFSLDNSFSYASTDWSSNQSRGFHSGVMSVINTVPIQGPEIPVIKFPFPVNKHLQINLLQDIQKMCFNGINTFLLICCSCQSFCEPSCCYEIQIDYI